MVLDGSTIERWLQPLLKGESQKGVEAVNCPPMPYREASPSEIKELRQEVGGFIENDSVVRAGPKRRDVWNSGWQENLDALVSGNDIAESVKPRYLRENHWYRMDGSLAWFENPYAEYEVLSAIRTPLFRKYFSDCDEVVEIGCGSGQNLHHLARLFPEKRFYGYDWVESSAHLIDELGRKMGRSISGRVFDMENPDFDIQLPTRTGILTFHAFEQLGDRFGPTLEFLLEKRPSIVVQVEPIEENYDLANPIDRLAREYHSHRGYLSGYLTALKELERKGRIEIDNAFRVPFGSRFHEANSVVAWSIK